MIKIRDAFLLANSKLRSHFFRTFSTVLIGGILFAVLIFGSLIFSRTEDSLKYYQSQGLNDRHIVLAGPVAGQEAIDKHNKIIENPDNVKLAKQLFADKIKQKTDAAKKLGVDYSPETEIAPYTASEGKEKLQFGDSNGIYNQILSSIYKKHRFFDEQNFYNSAKKYDATDFLRKKTYL